MFAVRLHHGRALHSPRLPINPRLPFSTYLRRLAPAAGSAAASRYSDKSLLQPHGPVAKQLAATGVWRAHGEGRSPASPASSASSPVGTPSAPRRRSKTKKVTGDKTRVNIVNEKLCDDVLSYIGSSLERHRGCDLLDLYPGAGLWSGKLHDFLQPRSHVLLEPDAELYRPFLQPILDKPGTTLTPLSGIIWRELTSVLSPEYLPHQVVPDDLNARNDTLLVTANLCFHPKKRFLNFESIAFLILHQFVHAIRHGSLFQRYGLVRMLIWTRTDDKLSFIPRNIQRRRRQALENDFVCEWVQEVCGGETAATGWFVREDAIDNASALATAKRMRAAHFKLPAGREPTGFLETLAALESKKRAKTPGKHIPMFRRPYHDVLDDLRAVDEKHSFDEESEELKMMNNYTWRESSDLRKAKRLHELSKSLDKLVGLYKAKAAPSEIAAASLEWNTEMLGCAKTLSDEFVTYKDNLNAYRRSPRLLQWDKRAYEPMTVESSEFFPNVHCSLLDIQPKAPHPLLRQSGPNSNRAGDIFDVILGSMMHHSTQTIGGGLDSLWPGAADYILPRWTSGQDLSRGAFPPNLRCAELSPRQMDARQWEELLELWMEWPFHPEFHEMVGRIQDDPTDKLDDSVPGEAL